MAQTRTLHQLSFKESFNPTPVGSKNNWKDALCVDKKELSALKKKKKKKRK
jgi:hypothetical protein